MQKSICFSGRHRRRKRGGLTEGNDSVWWNFIAIYKVRGRALCFNTAQEQFGCYLLRLISSRRSFLLYTSAESHTQGKTNQQTIPWSCLELVDTCYRNFNKRAFFLCPRIRFVHKKGKIISNKEILRSFRGDGFNFIKARVKRMKSYCFYGLKNGYSKGKERKLNKCFWHAKHKCQRHWSIFVVSRHSNFISATHCKDRLEELRTLGLINRNSSPVQSSTWI